MVNNIIEGNELTNKVGKVDFKKRFADIIKDDFYSLLDDLKINIMDRNLLNYADGGGCYCTWNIVDICDGSCLDNEITHEIKNGMVKYSIDNNEATDIIYKVIEQECEKITKKQKNDFFDLKFEIERYYNDIILNVYYFHNCGEFTTMEIVGMMDKYDELQKMDVYLNKWDVLNEEEKIHAVHSIYFNDRCIEDKEIQENWVSLDELRLSFRIINNRFGA